MSTDMGSFMPMDMPSICYCAGDAEIHGPADVPQNCIEEMSMICNDHFSDSVCDACQSTFTEMIVTEDCFMAVSFEIHHICSSGHEEHHDMGSMDMGSFEHFDCTWVNH